MVAARDARAWAADGGLRGIGDSLDTPFSGRDGDDTDGEACRTPVRYCVGDLAHESGGSPAAFAEWWALTVDERTRLLEVAVGEARVQIRAALEPGGMAGSLRGTGRRRA